MAEELIRREVVPLEKAEMEAKKLGTMLDRICDAFVARVLASGQAGGQAAEQAGGLVQVHAQVRTEG